jgi:formylglycine-generating enzyme required for sulfatase activity
MFYRGYDTAMDMLYTNKTAAAQVSDFRLDTYEVTVGRFRAFVNAGMGTSATAPEPGAGAHDEIPRSGWDPAWNVNLEINTEELVAALSCDSTYQTWNDTSTPNDNQPMNCLTWYEAMAFCIWDGGYLPTEAEWNYAASGGSEQRPYPWASDGSTTVDCTYADYSDGIASACMDGVTGGANRVGSESPKGDGLWGQADLAGNLSEWNLDWFTDTYPAPPCIDCANVETATSRVYRGGAFASTAPSLRVALRTNGKPAERSYTVGVRCARTDGQLRHMNVLVGAYPSKAECEIAAARKNTECYGRSMSRWDEYYYCAQGEADTYNLWSRQLAPPNPPTCPPSAGT